MDYDTHPADRVDDCHPSMFRKSERWNDGHRTVTAGQMIRVKGRRGRYRVLSFDLLERTVDCYGGTSGRPSWRTFPVAQIGQVDREATRRLTDA